MQVCWYLQFEVSIAAKLLRLNHQVLIPCDCFHTGRIVAAAQASSTSKVTKAKKPAPQADNPTLAQTESEPEVTPGRVDSGILEGGVSVALLDKEKDVEETGISSPEDFWTPLRPPPSKGEYKDQYGKLSPVPEHEGTDCLKTDDTLWTHAEHFKVHQSVVEHNGCCMFSSQTSLQVSIASCVESCLQQFHYILCASC